METTTITGNIYGNIANNGGGLYLTNSPFNTITGNVFTNVANSSGGGVYLFNSDYFTNNGWITNNYANISGGGVYTNSGHPNSYFGNVSGNSPNDFN